MIGNRSIVLVTSIGYFVGVTIFTLGSFGIVEVPGLTAVALALLLVPTLTFAFSERKRISETMMLTSVLMPVLLVNYLYSLKMGYPVGFQDVHSHINEADSLLSGQGFIEFSKAQTVSFSFVGLYVVAWFLRAAAGIGIVAVASFLPPLVNLLVALFVYLVARRIFDARIASLTIILFAWDNATILFGHEFRTQTIGTLFTLGALLAYLGRRQVSARLGFALTGILFLFALSTASFVSDIFALVLFTVLAATPIVVPKHRSLQRRSAQYGLFVAFSALYILYVSTTTYGSPSAVVSSIVVLTREAFSASSVPTLEVGQEIYGPVVRAFTYFFWAIFGIFFILLLRWRVIEQHTVSLPILLGLMATFAAGVAFSTFSILSPGRAYAVGSILIAMVVAAGLVTLSKRTKVRLKKRVVALGSLFVAMFVVISVAKFPAYVIGDTAPIRGHEIIDDVPYWRLSARDTSPADFLMRYGQGKQLHLDMLIAPFMILNLYEHGLEPAPSTHDNLGRLVPSHIQVGDLILLRNSYEDRQYAFRNLLPSEAEYDRLALVYADGDYDLFVVTS